MSRTHFEAGARKRSFTSKRGTIALGAALLATLVGVSACSGAPGGVEGTVKTKTLKLSTYMSEGTNESQTIQWFADQVEEKTNGEIKIQLFFSESLLKAGDTVPGVAARRAEMGFTNPSGYHPAEFTMTSVGEIPFQWPNIAAHIMAVNDIYNKNEDFRSQYEAQGVRPLFFIPSGESVLASVDKIADVSSLKGKQIRGAGRTGKMIGDAGATIVSMPASDVYQALDQKVVDGFTSFPFAPITSWSLQEVIGNVQDVGMGAYGAGGLIIGTNVWESLTENQRKIFTDLAEEATMKGIEFLGDGQDKACEIMREANVEMSVWSQDAIADLKRAAGGESIASNWVDEVSTDSLNGQQLLDDFTAAYESNAKEVDYMPAVARCAS